MNNKIKHLEMIQVVVTRMGSNLFILKGWSITLIVALFTLISRDVSGVYVLFAFCVLLIFWILDGYFLSLERCFRDLYDDVRMKKDEDIDFSMNCKKFMKGKNSWIKSMFSSTILIFYGILLVVMVIITVMSSVNSINFNFGINWKNRSNAIPATSIITTELNKK
ncbi:MAG: hypothetical protein PHC34_10090 [Candidatus Gastranaerophilales bacterium]|nr:hypothetical protein [Candidatus Gastranaerophilales bacterium]